MDASCKIQRSIHDVRLTYKYVSRILGTYQIGAFITITVIQSMGALGPAKAAMLIVISQLIVAYVIELLGMFGTMQQPFEWRKILGMLIAIAGIVIFKWE